MDPTLPLYLQICLSIIIVGGAIAVVLAIVALAYAIQISRQINDAIDRSKDSFVRLTLLVEGAVTHVKQALQIAQMLKGVVSTLQKTRGRGKK
ncbi:MAG: hypothetical protein Q8P11_02290 [bacterium]|nr:hypothetical protein [bacterium]